MKIDRKEFLVLAAAMWFSLSLAGCIVVPASTTPARGGPPGGQPGNEGPDAECVDRDANGECIAEEGDDDAQPAARCVEWDPSGECVGWEGDSAAPAGECREWDPDSTCGECLEWDDEGNCITREGEDTESGDE